MMSICKFYVADYDLKKIVKDYLRWCQMKNKTAFLIKIYQISLILKKFLMITNA